MNLSTTLPTEALLPHGLWTVDTAASSVRFDVRHLLFATVHGTFSDVSGVIRSNYGGLTAEGVVEVASVETGDQVRDERLVGEGFFDAERHPQIRFHATEAVASGPSTWRVTGDLTIAGQTHPLTFEATSANEDRGIVVRAKSSISRREHGLDWPGLLAAGRAVVGDRVGIELELVLR